MFLEAILIWWSAIWWLFYLLSFYLYFFLLVSLFIAPHLSSQRLSISFFSFLFLFCFLFLGKDLNFNHCFFSYHKTHTFSLNTLRWQFNSSELFRLAKKFNLHAVPKALKAFLAQTKGGGQVRWFMVDKKEKK